MASKKTSKKKKCEDFAKIPQFFANPNFRKFTYVLIFAVIIISSIFLFYREYVFYSDEEAKKSLLHSVLKTYHKEKGGYPEELNELVDANFINILPKKLYSEKEFEYIPHKDEKTGEIIDYEL